MLLQLSDYVKRHPGRLPGRDEYLALPPSKYSLPPYTRIQEAWGGMAGGWRAAGASLCRLPARRRRWTQEEEDVLLEDFGKYPPSYIAAVLGRTVASVKNRMADRGLTNGRAGEWLSVNTIKRELSDNPQGRQLVHFRLEVLLHGGELEHAYHDGSRWHIRWDSVEPWIPWLTRPRVRWKMDGAA